MCSPSRGGCTLLDSFGDTMVTGYSRPLPSCRPVRVILHSASRQLLRHKRCRVRTAADSPSESEAGGASKVRRCLGERASGRLEQCKVCCLLMKRDSSCEAIGSKSTFSPLRSSETAHILCSHFLSAGCFNLDAKSSERKFALQLQKFFKSHMLSERMQNIFLQTRPNNA